MSNSQDNENSNANVLDKYVETQVIHCGGWCSKHNPTRSVSYHTCGAYLAGMWEPCFCDCKNCIEREQQINAEIAYADEEVRLSKIAYDEEEKLIKEANGTSQ